MAEEKRLRIQKSPDSPELSQEKPDDAEQPSVKLNYEATKCTCESCQISLEDIKEVIEGVK